MAAESTEAIVRKHAKRREKTRLELQKSDWPCYKIAARNMRPKLAKNISKAELREMLAQAAANTVKP